MTTTNRFPLTVAKGNEWKKKKNSCWDLPWYKISFRTSADSGLNTWQSPRMTSDFRQRLHVFCHVWFRIGTNEPLTGRWLALMVSYHRSCHTHWAHQNSAHLAQTPSISLQKPLQLNQRSSHWEFQHLNVLNFSFALWWAGIVRKWLLGIDSDSL